MGGGGGWVPGKIPGKVLPAKGGGPPPGPGGGGWVPGKVPANPAPLKGPPPLPWKKAVPAPVGALVKANKQALKANTGRQVGDARTGCQWTLRVDVKSNEQFWPRKTVEVKLYAPADVAKRGAADKSASVNMMLNYYSFKTAFQGVGPKTYDVSASTAETGWELVTGKASKTLLANEAERVSIDNRQQKYVRLWIRHPLWVNLQLQFKNPAGDKVLNFPAKLPVKVLFDDNSHLDVETANQGKLKFEVDRKYKHFTLQFDDGNTYWISNGDTKTLDTSLQADADLAQLHKDNAKFFMLPRKWSLVESLWDVQGEPSWEAKKAEFETEVKGDWVLRIGTPANPVAMILDPKWHFARWEYFDRYYGHTDHNHERVNMPPSIVDGYRDSSAKLPDPPDTRSHWTINDDNRAKSVHCIPWVIQKKADGTAEPKPDKLLLLKFATDAQTFAYSSSETVRKTQAVADAKDLAASAKRLKYYDLPREWWSKKYYTRFSDGTGDFFEDVAAKQEAKIQASNAAATPLIFSLDDIVLTDAAGAEVALTKDDSIAVFYHRFKPAANAGKTSAIGVHKPDTGNEQSFYSDYKGKTNQFNYITDYPDWVRLVVVNGGLFDTFDQRTTGNGGNQVFGARAAARWFDPLTQGIEVGKAINPAPAEVVKDYFALQPYYGQDYNARNAQYNPGGFQLSHIGRFDMALLRCCDRDGDKELVMNMQYFRFMNNFMDPPKISNVKLPHVTESEVEVSWATDKNTPGTSRDVQGAGGFGDFDDPTLGAAHGLVSSGYAAGTELQFRLEAYDEPSNTKGYSGNYLVSTLPAAAEIQNDPGSPDITDITVRNVTNTAGTLSWTQPAGSKGYAKVGTTNAVSDGSGNAIGANPAFALAAPAGSKYYFQISAHQDPAPKGKELWRKLDVQWVQMLKGPFQPKNDPLERHLHDANKKTATLSKKQWIEKSALNLTNRFNGEDTVNTTRAKLSPQSNKDLLWGEVVYFIQPMSTYKHSHYQLDIGSYGRCSMSPDGFGEIDAIGYDHEDQYQKNSYTFAHELGHGASLPDEYSERSQWASAHTPGVLCNTPGDPFIDEGVYAFNTAASIFKANIKTGDVPSSMMNQAVQVRNRHYWHNAEFLRKYTKVPLKVEWGKYADYKVPGHPNFPVKSYAYWPASAQVNATIGSRGKLDVYLYTAGKDAFAQTYIPNGPHDGFLMALVKIKLSAPAKVDMYSLITALRGAILDYNAKHYATGTLSVATDNGNKDWTFSKCRVQVTPRFLDASDGGAANIEKDAKGVHFNVTVLDANSGDGFHGGNNLKLAASLKAADAQDRLAAQFKRYFAQMLGGGSGILGIGVAQKITPDILKGVARLVLPGANIADY